MGSVPTPGRQLKLEELSDLELIDLLPATGSEKYDPSYQKLGDEEKQELKDKRESFIREEYRKVLDALWLRHRANIRQLLRHKVFEPGSTLCPPQQPSREDFIETVLTLAYQRFLHGTLRRPYGNFPGYVWTIAMRAALDERKHLKGRLGKGKTRIGNVTNANPERPILVDIPEEQPEPVGAEIDLLALDVKRILDAYAEESDENMVSARALRWKWMEEWTWEEVADKLLPASIGTESLQKRVSCARKFVTKDEDKLLARLAPYGRQQGGSGGK